VGRVGGRRGLLGKERWGAEKGIERGGWVWEGLGRVLSPAGKLEKTTSAVRLAGKSKVRGENQELLLKKKPEKKRVAKSDNGRGGKLE